MAGRRVWVGLLLSALPIFTGTDEAAYVALDASLTSLPDRPFTYTLPLIDLATSPKVTVAMQNIGQGTTSGTWHAWPMTDTTSSISGTFTLPPGAATHIALGAHVTDDFQGAVHVNADSPLAVVAMSQASNTQSVYTAQPVGEPMAPDAALRGLIPTQSDWETELWIHNTSPSQTAQATAVFQDFSGQAVYTATEAIPARGTWRLDVSSLPLPSAWRGWARITGSPDLQATTRLLNSETEQQADVETFTWPPSGLQASSRTQSFPSMTDRGLLYANNPDQSGPLSLMPAFFAQNGLLDLLCESLSGGQSSLQGFPVPPGFRGSMLIQSRTSLSAKRVLSPLSVYLDPTSGLGYTPAGLPYVPQLMFRGEEIKCGGMAGLMAPEWDILQGETRPFDLRLEDVGEVTRIDLGATFDPTILAVEDTDPETPGSQIQPGPAIDDTWVITRNTVTAGQLTYTLGLSGSGTALPDAGSIGVIPFTGQQIGKTAVTVTIRSITSTDASPFFTQPLTVTRRIRVVAATPTSTATPTATPTPTPTPTIRPSTTPEPRYELYLPLVLRR